MNFGDYTENLKALAKRHEGAKISLEMLTPESRQQRKFYEGAVIPLWAYLDDKDYKDNQVCENMREVAKIEFNGAMEEVGGKVYKIGKSTKGELNKGFLERVIENLEEQYGIDRKEVLNPADYKHWRDTIFPYGGPNCYIDYLIDCGRLKKKIASVSPWIRPLTPVRHE